MKALTNDYGGNAAIYFLLIVSNFRFYEQFLFAEER